MIQLALRLMITITSRGHTAPSVDLQLKILVIVRRF